MKLPLSVSKKFSSNESAALLGFAIFLTLLLTPDKAQASTVGGVIDSFRVQINAPGVNLFNYLAYIFGAFFVLRGLIKLKEHADRPDAVPFIQPALNILGGGLLATLPVLGQMLKNSLNMAATGGFAYKNAATGYVGASSTGLDAMLINFVTNVRGPALSIILVISFLLGIYFLLTAILRFAKNGGKDGPAGSLSSGTVGRMVFGAALISFASVTDVFTRTFFGSTIVQFTGLSPSLGLTGIDRFNNAIKAGLMFFQVIGLIAFMRGFLMLRALADGSQGASTAAAFTHLIGGALAFNISPTLRAIQNTFGISVGSFS